MNATTELATVTPITRPDPYALIEKAIDKGIDVSAMQALFDLQRQFEADNAKRAYFAAKSEFQATAPPIPKTKEVLNKDGKSIRYKYAPLDTIIKTLRVPLQVNKLSWSFEVKRLEADAREVKCTLTHEDGYSEESTVYIPSITGFGTNAAQDEGSAITYGKRYSFAGVTGVTIDEDNDGATAAPENLDRLIKHNKAVAYWLETIVAVKAGIAEGGDQSAAAEAYAELPRQAIFDLNVAPTKGGIWTTVERRFIDSDKEFQAEVTKHRNDAGWHDKPENHL